MSTAYSGASKGPDITIKDVTEQPQAETENRMTDEVDPNMGQQSLFVRTDVTDETPVLELVERTVDEFGSVDILVNDAGLVVRKPVDTVN